MREAGWRMKFLRPAFRLLIVELSTKRKIIKYLLFGLTGLILSSGPVCMAYIFAMSDPAGYVVWLWLPCILMMFGEIWLTLKIFIPRFLDTGRYTAFGLSVVAASYLLNLAAIWMVHDITVWLDVPVIVKDPLSVWVWVEGVAGCMMSLFLLCGMALWHVFDKSELQNKREREIKRIVEEKTRKFKERIRMGEVREMLEEAASSVESNPVAANNKIHKLSDLLRSSLYDKDGKFAIEQALEEDGKRKEENVDTRITDFFISRKYRVVRHVCLIVLYLIVSTGLLFAEPDNPDFSVGSLIYTGMFFLIMLALTYLNVFVAFPFFQRRGKVRLYGWCLFIILALFGVMMYASVYQPEGIYNSFGVRVPDFIILVSLVGNMLTFFFIFAGTGCIMLLKENMKGKWRISHEETEAARLEFETLQQQVNPHFLFNVLNNAGILSYEDPQEAKATLEGLKSFLDYMLSESGRRWITVGEEVKLIEDYLTMEMSSGKELKVEMRIEEGIRECRLGSLLLIPFVENAVKYAEEERGTKVIRIEIFTNDGNICFVCQNKVGKRERSSSGGLGIANTRRRLELLYGKTYRLNAGIEGDDYKVGLTIPEKR